MTPEVSLHTDPAVDEVLRTVESWPVESVRALQNRLNTLYPPKDHLSTDLPWELIEHVLSFITSPVTLGKLARVSRVWNYWIHCTSAWRRLFLLAQSVDPETLERLSLSVVSPSSSAPTITRNPDAILTIDEITWKEIYRQALLINENWSSGLCSASDFQAHSETVYCMDFDSSCIMTGSRDGKLFF